MIIETITMTHIISILELIIIGIMIFSSKVSNKDLNEIKSFSKIINKNYLQTLKNTIYSSSRPTLERLIAFKEYLKLGGNGNCKSFSIKNLILPNKELWQSVIDNDVYEEVKINNDHYNTTLNEINTIIF